MDDLYKVDGVLGTRKLLFDIVRSIDDGVRNSMVEESAGSPACPNVAKACSDDNTSVYNESDTDPIDKGVDISMCARSLFGIQSVDVTLNGGGGDDDSMITVGSLDGVDARRIFGGSKCCLSKLFLSGGNVSDANLRSHGDHDRQAVHYLCSMHSSFEHNSNSAPSNEASDASASIIAASAAAAAAAINSNSVQESYSYQEDMALSIQVPAGYLSHLSALTNSTRPM
eukprot:2159936-Ditylum_brightwellii.AAC.1